MYFRFNNSRLSSTTERYSSLHRAYCSAVLFDGTWCPMYLTLFFLPKKEFLLFVGP